MMAYSHAFRPEAPITVRFPVAEGAFRIGDRVYFTVGGEPVLSAEGSGFGFIVRLSVRRTPEDGFKWEAHVMNVPAKLIPEIKAGNAVLCAVST